MEAIQAAREAMNDARLFSRAWKEARKTLAELTRVGSDFS